MGKLSGCCCSGELLLGESGGWVNREFLLGEGEVQVNEALLVDGSGGGQMVVVGLGELFGGDVGAGCCSSSD